MTGKVIDIRGAGAVVLVNRERVLHETLELTRFRIARKLEILPEQVSASCTASEGKLRVEFSVDEDVTVDPDRVKEVTKAEYSAVRLMAQDRFAGLGAQRGNEEEEKTTLINE